MEREIKFRGRTKEGMWLYGNLIQFNGKTSIVSNKEVEDTPLDCVGGKIITGIVDKDTVGQFTGLKDKNGKEIYEGDILRSDKYPFSCGEIKGDYFAEVCWWDNSPEFGLYLHKNPKASVRGISDGITGNMEGWEPSSYKVVGNIWENKDLIE